MSRPAQYALVCQSNVKAGRYQGDTNHNGPCDRCRFTVQFPADDIQGADAHERVQQHGPQPDPRIGKAADGRNGNQAEIGNDERRHPDQDP